MDRTAWIVVILCSLGLAYWWTNLPKPQPRTPETTETQSAEDSAPGTPTTSAETPEAPGTTFPTSPEVEKIGEETLVLRTKDAEFTLTNVGAGIATAKLLDHASSYRSDIPVTLNEYSLRPVGALSTGVGKIEGTGYSTLEKSDSGVTYEADTPDGLHVTKSYALAPADAPGSGYTLTLKLTLKNSSPDTTLTSSEYYLYNGTTAPLYPKEPSFQRGFLYFREGKAKIRTVDDFKKKDKQNFEEACDNLQWGSVTDQFFAQNISAAAPYSANVWAQRVPIVLNEGEADPDSDEAARSTFGVHGATGLPILNLAPGQEISFDYEFYLGPKEYSVLRDMGRERDAIMQYNSLPVFGWIAAPFSKLLMSFLVVLHGFTGNYGVAIILITLTIRILIWPLHNKAQNTMKRMSLLTPMMTEMKEKYKDTPQRLNQEMMKLYRDYGVNPFGGCLPIFLQMPIFLGFFGMLRSAVELRHEQFLWVKDLSMPDTLFHLPGLGIPFNVLPLLMGVTMILQMRMTPKTGDKAQQRIFMFMPLIFLVICYNYASALALYWTAQNIISIGQTMISKRKGDVVLEKRKPAPKRAPMAAPGQPQKKLKPKGPRTGG